MIVQFQYHRGLFRNYMRHLAIRALSCLALLLCAWIAAANQGPRATFVVGPGQPLLDDRLSISVSGLPPNRLITVKARSKAQDQLWWRSEAVFNSGVQGTIDLRAQTPVSGSYRGADGMGLFWSMKPDAATRYGDHAFFAITDWFQPVVTEIEADDAGQTLGSVVIERRLAKPGVRCTAIAQDGIDGLLCDPGDGRRHPGVIVLGGSEGGAGMPDATCSSRHTGLQPCRSHTSAPRAFRHHCKTSRLKTSERRSGGCAIAPKQIPVLLRYSEYPGVRRQPYSSRQRIPMCRLSWQDPRAMFDGKAPQPDNSQVVQSGPGKASR